MVEPLSPMAPPDAQAAASSSVEPLSPMAPPDAQAAASSMVEPLSPMAPPNEPAAASCGFSAAFLTWPGALHAPIDWGQSIYHASGFCYNLRVLRQHPSLSGLTLFLRESNEQQPVDFRS